MLPLHRCWECNAIIPQGIICEECKFEELKEAVAEFMDILETKEESMNGTEFHPVTISSCRVMKTQQLREIFEVFKKYAKKNDETRIVEKPEA